MALPNTPLLKRLQAEGRLLDMEWTEMNGHGAADCNFIPKQMSLDELRRGYSWLIRSLYRYDSYGARLATLLSRYQNRNAEHKRAALDVKFLGLLFKVLGYFLLTRDRERRQFFTKTFRSVAGSGPFSVGKWLEFFRWVATYRSFRQYVIQTQGIPESADPKKPVFPRPLKPSFPAESREPSSVSTGIYQEQETRL